MPTNSSLPTDFAESVRDVFKTELSHKIKVFRQKTPQATQVQILSEINRLEKIYRITQVDIDNKFQQHAYLTMFLGDANENPLLRKQAALKANEVLTEVIGEIKRDALVQQVTPSPTHHLYNNLVQPSNLTADIPTPSNVAAFHMAHPRGVRANTNLYRIAADLNHGLEGLEMSQQDRSWHKRQLHRIQQDYQKLIIQPAKQQSSFLTRILERCRAGLQHSQKNQKKLIIQTATIRPSLVYESYMYAAICMQLKANQYVLPKTEIAAMLRHVEGLNHSSMDLGSLIQKLKSAQQANTAEEKIQATNAIMYFCGSKLSDPNTNKALTPIFENIIKIAVAQQPARVVQPLSEQQQDTPPSRLRR